MRRTAATRGLVGAALALSVVSMSPVTIVGALWACTETPALDAVAPADTPINPIVEVEEEVYRFTAANNGAGPMWCHGNTSIVRRGDTVLASGLETLTNAKPLNNCLPLLFARTADTWEQIYRGRGRTREPSPLATFPDGRVFLSTNPTLTPPDAYNGPAEPRLLEFSADTLTHAPITHVPSWDGKPRFTEHSYRSFAADGPHGELILIQNIGYNHAEWTFRDKTGKWSASGKLVWPWGAEYDKPQRIRVCYPTVALANRAVHFCGVSDIIEPYDEWRKYKQKLTERQWDYDFRRLFYTWSDDIRRGEFHDWVEVASRDKTCGWLSPKDLHVAPDGDVFVLWTERALDERLRPKFFPNAKQRHALECALLRRGKVVHRVALVEGGEDNLGGNRPGDARFHSTPDGRLLAIYFVGGTDAHGTTLAEHRITEIRPDGSHRPPVTLELKTPLSSFFAASTRAGCAASWTIDLLGQSGNTMRYARIRLR